MEAVAVVVEVVEVGEVVVEVVEVEVSAMSRALIATARAPLAAAAEPLPPEFRSSISTSGASKPAADCLLCSQLGNRGATAALCSRQ